MLKTLSRLALGVVLLASVSTLTISCKSKKTKDEEVVTPVPPAEQVPMTTQPAPVTISSDDSLANGIATATKDFPTVVAELKDGEVVLTGSIDKTRLPKLIQAITLLHPKKITNQLTIK